jgi:hypothetical protein
MRGARRSWAGLVARRARPRPRPARAPAGHIFVSALACEGRVTSFPIDVHAFAVFSCQEAQGKIFVRTVADSASEPAKEYGSEWG